MNFASRRSGGDPDLHFVEGPAHGPPLLLLHGVARCWKDFQPLLPSLLQEWQVFALDLRGHGDSARAQGHYRVTDYVGDVARLLREQFHQPVALYGHSLGAMVALAAAAEAPDRVWSIALEDPPFHMMGQRLHTTPYHSIFTGLRTLAGSKDSVDEIALRLAEVPVVIAPGDPPMRLGALRDAASLRFSAECLAVLDPAVFDPLLPGRWLEGYDTTRILERVQCSTLLLQGDPAAGAALTDADAELLLRTIPGCRRVRFAGAGHQIHLQQPESVLDAFREFSAGRK